MQPRKGIPASMLEMEIQAGKTPKLRAKEPSARPDIRVITSYDISRKQNFEDIAEIIGEDQMRRVRTYTEKINKLNDEIDAKIVESQELALIRSELKIKRAGETDVELISPRGKLVNAEGAFAGPNGFLTRQDVKTNITKRISCIYNCHRHIPFYCLLNPNIKVYQACNNNKPSTHFFFLNSMCFCRIYQNFDLIIIFSPLCMKL